MKKLIEKNRDKALDLLGERLAFERASVQLYDTLLARIRLAGDRQFDLMRSELEKIRAEEKAHEELLEALVRSVGGDARARTDRVALVEKESEGIRDVVQRDPLVPHAMHALLAAELVDSAGWDLLVELAGEAGDRDAKKAFRKCLREEARHVGYVREAVQKMARRDVLGETIDLPTSAIPTV